MTFRAHKWFQIDSHRPKPDELKSPHKFFIGFKSDENVGQSKFSIFFYLNQFKVVKSLWHDALLGIFHL